MEKQKVFKPSVQPTTTLTFTSTAECEAQLTENDAAQTLIII